ncbi:vitelline membrane protein 15a-2-like [Penaeus chinensis]|uniref:vitelline membrane protein 15a-2-like n=1 Tax=Penaeus chinensis TaxID=139456 RepID=UPI001FB58949|nr:vitelline membrane protein 15a-2-like [Penaeus chinensis]
MQIAVIACLAVVAIADQSPHPPPPAPYHPPPPAYHSEPHYPDASSSEIHLQLRHLRQIVKYEDNGDGLVAQVTYEGEAQYPEHTPTYRPAPPAYAPPPPARYE